MGRPSLAAQRRPQLLQAYAECLVRYGVVGTTLDRVAKQAGVTRGLVRHYLGNREEVIRALGDWARDGFLEWFDEISNRHPQDDAEGALLEMWVVEQPPQLVAVLDALFAEAGRDPYIAEVLRSVYEAFFRWTVGRLTLGFPGAAPAARRQVALALMSLGWADTGFEVIGFRPTRGREYRAIAERLLDSLR
jgi:AcrR family transcriptional regulator